MVKERKKGKAAVFKKRDGSSVFFNAKVSRFF